MRYKMSSEPQRRSALRALQNAGFHATAPPLDPTDRTGAPVLEISGVSDDNTTQVHEIIRSVDAKARPQID